MNIVRNAEAVFLAVAVLAIATAGVPAAADTNLAAQPALDGKVHTVVVSAKRLAPSTDRLVAAN